ncbi:heat stress transcription factor B-4 [Prunus yedoensis var. nudiflora]|uniref:Heat stress transcription factor B-4 n=1 Tax=Prunus yedoensis var. nudiflora TaxID=2094558 RepID=A0A314ZED1_PRUYE|nr:heat stress transcription factor B-4 [Prunus yedoensis var. nudiflora]
MALMIDNCEGILLSLDSHKSVPAPFLTKTYQLVDDPATDHIVSWGEDDATFVVWRPPEFARDLLPNYFKHNNFSSFVRQLNTYGFRKIVPDRWEFANEFFKKGEKHLLCEIHRRKTAQPHQVGFSHHHHHHNPHSPLGINGHHHPSFFPFPSSGSISPSDSDEPPNWCDSDSPPLPSPTGGINNHNNNNNNFMNINNPSVTGLAEDNERLRRSNSVLMSELAHMRKLYNDIIYFVQNHVKPVAPSNSYPSSLLLCNPPPNSMAPAATATKPSNFNQLLGYYPAPPTNAKQTPHMSTTTHHHVMNSSSPSNTTSKSSSVTFLRTSNNPVAMGAKIPSCFGVPLLHSKKRLHPEEYGSNHGTSIMEASKARLILEKDDLGLHLMPPSAC